MKYEVEGIQGVWMRTHGADVFGSHDIAALTEGHHEGSTYFDLFNTILDYQFSGAKLAAEETMQVDDSTYIKFREPLETEEFLRDAKPVLVLEMITEAEINR